MYQNNLAQGRSLFLFRTRECIYTYNNKTGTPCRREEESINSDPVPTPCWDSSGSVTLCISVEPGEEEI